MNVSKVDTAARLVKNSAAMFTASALAKVGGLIATILIARYLGPASLGIYAVVLALALLLEVVTPLGQQEVIIRAIARDRSLLLRHWVNASATTIVFSLGVCLLLVGFVRLADYGADATLAVYVTAIGLPAAGLNLVAQAALQGIEEMQYQTAAAFVGRLLGLLLLWGLLELDAGIWAAFLARAVFQVTSLAILSRAILQHARRADLDRVWRPSFLVCRANLRSALPFALQRFLAEGLSRLNVIILPMLVSLTTVGLFNAANQLTQTSSMIIPTVTLTLLPLFSRTFASDRDSSRALIGHTLKALLALILPFAFVITVLADKLILLLYGSGYEASVSVLQVVIWSQVFVAADSVMKQGMIASDNERAMVWRSAIGAAVSVALTVVLGNVFGLMGIATAVVVATSLLFLIDAVFLTTHVCRIDWLHSLGKLFLAGALVGALAMTLGDHNLVVVLLATTGGYILLLALLGVFTPGELAVMRRVAGRFVDEARR